ncbi:MAG TPA: YdeI/OmpD-associated family protein [Opitutaceae bacterium]|nr:YdeI/OmpD-associated family protein [Opitutaceae bacterium]
MPAPEPSLIVKGPIRKVGVFYVVELSAAEVKALGGTKARLPVVVNCLGTTYLSTVMPAGKGKGRVHVLVESFRPAGLKERDEITLELREDRSSRDVALPADLKRALQYRPVAMKGWEAAPVSYRRAMMGYLDSARQANTRAARLEIFLERLAERGEKTRNPRKDGKKSAP